MNRNIRLAILAGATVCFVGCGLLFGSSQDDLAPPQNSEVSLHVINQNFYDARLLARWRNGRRVSIGQVTGFDEQTFTLRWEGHDLRVEINLLSVGRHVTPWMMVEHGDELELVIDAALDRSIRIRRP